MKIVIPGGSGQLGTLLAQTLSDRGDDVVILSRLSKNGSELHKTAAGRTYRSVAWNTQTSTGQAAQDRANWTKEIDGSDVVINLAGRSVNCRYTAENKTVIKESRVQSTKAIGNAIANAINPPKVWLQMSTAAIYAHRFDAANDEITGIIGGEEKDAPDEWRFSIDVATAWESAQDEANVPSTRKVKLRTSIVMSPEIGNPFDILLRLVRFGLGGQSGDGRQFVSWIIDLDFVRAIEFLIEHPEIDGPVNLAAPNPLPNADFMRYLREAWGAPLGLPASKLMLEIGAIPLQTETELVLKSRRVVPQKLLAENFQFDFPTWDLASKNLCKRWRSIRQSNRG